VFRNPKQKIKYENKKSTKATNTKISEKDLKTKNSLDQKILWENDQY